MPTQPPNQASNFSSSFIEPSGTPGGCRCELKVVLCIEGGATCFCGVLHAPAPCARPQVRATLLADEHTCPVTWWACVSHGALPQTPQLLLPNVEGLPCPAAGSHVIPLALPPGPNEGPSFSVPAQSQGLSWTLHRDLPPAPGHCGLDPLSLILSVIPQ